MSFLTIADSTADRLASLVEVGLAVKANPDDYRDVLDGRSVGLFFQKQSLRTWVSCDIATIQLGAHPIVIRNDQTGLGSREAPADVGRVLGRYLDALGMRVFDHRDLTEIDDATEIPLINLLSDLEHPCQAVADMMTVADHLPLEEATITYVGDGNNVCHSLMLAAVKLGSAFRVVAPPGYEPDPAVTELARSIGDVTITSDLVQGVIDSTCGRRWGRRPRPNSDAATSRDTRSHPRSSITWRKTPSSCTVSPPTAVKRSHTR